METAKDICVLLKKPNAQFKNEDSLTLYYNDGLVITIDLNIRCCRINKNWILQKAIDLDLQWNDIKNCSEIIYHYAKLSKNK